MIKVILFDGECSFCSRSVQFILKRDNQSVFNFASLQSAVGQTYLQNFNIPRITDSLVLIDNNQYYLESTAVLKICQQLKGLWKGCVMLRIIPRPFRDLVYRFIAKHRYHMIGKNKSCHTPNIMEKKRILH